jgi:hypothetical protein
MDFGHHGKHCNDVIRLWIHKLAGLKGSIVIKIINAKSLGYIYIYIFSFSYQPHKTHTTC